MILNIWPIFFLIRVMRKYALEIILSTLKISLDNVSHNILFSL